MPTSWQVERLLQLLVDPHIDFGVSLQKDFVVSCGISQLGSSHGKLTCERQTRHLPKNLKAFRWIIQITSRNPQQVIWKILNQSDIVAMKAGRIIGLARYGL